MGESILTSSLIVAILHVGAQILATREDVRRHGLTSHFQCHFNFLGHQFLGLKVHQSTHILTRNNALEVSSFIHVENDDR